MGIALPSEPSATMLNLSALVYLLGITIVTWCITRSTDNYPLWSKEPWTNMPWPRLCLLLVFIDSWLYLFLTGMLLHGAPPEHGLDRCSFGMLVCILLYGASKGLIYLCLIERVHVVWSDGMPRWRSPVYRFCFALVLPLGLIAGVMIFQKTAFVYNGYCILGISRFSSLLLLGYDFCTNLFLTIMFIAPLLRSSIRSPWLKAIAIRTTVAACIALVSSGANVIVLYVLDGKEMIWVCLGACGIDMVVNAIVLFWAMHGPGPSPTPRPHSIHFPPSPQPHFHQPVPRDVRCLEMGSVHKDSILYPTATIDFAQTNENYVSQGMTVTSSVCIPSLEEPEPALRSPHHAAQFGQHPWGNRSPLPTPTSGKQPLSRSNSQQSSDSLREGGLVQSTAQDSEIYGSNFDRNKYAEKGRRSSATPPPPSQ